MSGNYMRVKVVANGQELLYFQMDSENTQVNVNPLKAKEVVEALRYVADEIEKDFGKSPIASEWTAL